MDTETAVERLRFQPFRLGACLVEPQLNRITCDGALVRVEPKVMEVLILLCARPGEVISKDELFQSVWSQTFVTDHVLSHAVWQLRKALGKPELIEAIPKRGYRVTEEVHFDTSPLCLGTVTTEDFKKADSAQIAAIHTADRRRLSWLWIPALAAMVLIVTFMASRLNQKSAPTTLKPVALISGDARMPSISPDGSKVVFAWNGGKGNIYNLYIQQIGSTGPPMRLTSSLANDTYPAWSPDDRWIAFTRAPKIPGDNSTIMLIPSIGGPERRLVEIVTPRCTLEPGTNLSWMPDGKWLGFAAVDSSLGPYSIWAISIETGERRRLTLFPSQRESVNVTFGDRNPSFSPDGSTLAFARSSNSRIFQMYVLRLTRDLLPSGEARRITDQQYAFVGSIAWTGDNRDLIFEAGELGSTFLWRVPVSGTQSPQRLPYGQPDSSGPAISNAQHRLIYTATAYKGSLMSQDTRTGERRLLFDTTTLNGRLGYSPDNTRIAFASTSDRDGNSEIWTCDADGANCTQLTSFGGPRASAPNWSSDGKWIVFTARVEGKAASYVIPADGGKPRRIGNFPADELFPSFSHDGRAIYFTSNQSDRNEIWKVPIDEGPEVQVTHSGGLIAIESPDGKYLFYTKSETSSLFRMPVSGGAEEELVHKVLRGVSFAVTAKGVYFQPDEFKIQFLDTARGGVSTIAILNEPAAIITASRDDRYVAWFRKVFVAGSLMLVEGFR